MRFVTKNDETVSEEALDELLAFLNSFAGRNILNEEVAGLLS